MKQLILIIMGVLCLTSCKKFLEEYSQSDVIPKNTRDFGEILYTNGYPGINTRLQPWMVFLDDDMQCFNGEAIKDPTIVTSVSAIFQWQPDFITRTTVTGVDLNLNTWNTYYQLLLGANVALQYLDKASGPQAEKDQFKGEAYTLRAFYHFMLVNIYARPYNDSTTTPDKSPGVPIRTTANLSDGYLPRNTVKEVYTQIVNDLDSAIILLDKQKKTGAINRVSHVAARLLASRVHLFMENWDKCIEHADQVLLYHPQLMDLNTWGGVPDPDNKPLVGMRNTEAIWVYGDPEEQSPSGYSRAYDLSLDLVNTFETNDLRTQIAMSFNPPFMKEFLAVDYSHLKNTGGGLKGADFGTSWRSAEAYLNRAEAYIQKYRTKGDAGAATKALNSLNTLRAGRIDKGSFTPWQIKPADILLQQCRAERRRELFREETFRWFDLRRYGMPSIKHIYTPDLTTTHIYRLKARDPQYIIPIPEEVIGRNPALVQNPLYTGLRPHE